MSTNTTIPIILNGKYFKVKSQEGLKITATCVQCEASNPGSSEIKGAINSTSNFLTHLKRKHKSTHVTYEEDVAATKKVRRLPAINSSQRDISTFATVDQSKTITKVEKLIVNFVINGVHSLSTVSEKAFIDLVNGLMPNERFRMSPQTLQRRICTQAQEMKNKMVRDLEVTAYLCITADAWTSKGNRRAFLGITVHWITETLPRESYALACRRFKGDHNYLRIAEMITQILMEFNIKISKVTKAVTDNGTNFVKCFAVFATDEHGIENVTEDEDLSDGSDILSSNFISIDFLLQNVPSQQTEDDITMPPHHKCSSHTLSLICTTDVTKQSSRLSRSAFPKCQGIWNKVGRSAKTNEKIDEILGKRLSKPCVTRWNSLFDCLVELLKYKDKLALVCKELGTPELTEREIRFCEEYCVCVKPVPVALDRLQGECNTYYGQLLPTLMALQTKLVKLCETKPETCDWLPKVLLDSFRRRFQSFLDFDVKHQDCVVAAICHPYFKVRWIPSEKADECKNIFFDEACKFKSALDLNQKNTPMDNYRLDDEFFEFNQIECQNQDDDLIDIRIRHQCHEFWSDVSQSLDCLSKYPIVNAMFKKFNTALPSSAPVERLFNYSGMILNPKRQRLTDENFEILTLLKINKFFA